MNDCGIGEGIQWLDSSIGYRIAVASEDIASETYETLHIQNHVGAGKLRVWGFDEISFENAIRIHTDNSNTLTDKWSMEYDSTSDDLVFNFIG
jgi:HD-like signal output (HDOD) protein